MSGTSSDEPATSITTLPPAADWGTYAAVLAETVRQLLEHPGSRTTADRARDLLARWDDGEPFDLHRQLTGVLDDVAEVDHGGCDRPDDLIRKMKGMDPMEETTGGPRPEVAAAAAWWAQQLAEPATQDVGMRDAAEMLSTGLAQAAAALGRREWTAGELAAFEAALAVRLEAHVGNGDCWDPGCPERGSALRTIGCDYGPDPVLADAADDAGLGRLRSFDLPMKTVMWINPGRVSVAVGYHGQVVDVWRDG
jgi:hypothetical protein